MPKVNKVKAAAKAKATAKIKAAAATATTSSNFEATARVRVRVKAKVRAGAKAKAKVITTLLAKVTTPTLRRSHLRDRHFLQLFHLARARGAPSAPLAKARGDVPATEVAARTAANV